MSNKYISDQSNQFKNKIIIVTGSTQGSGAETAKLLASRGAKGITICGRNRDKGNKVKSEIESIGTECFTEEKSELKPIATLWVGESFEIKLGLFFSSVFKASKSLSYSKSVTNVSDSI